MTTAMLVGARALLRALGSAAPVAIALLAACARPAAGQEAGWITGTVTTAGGQPIAGATVRIPESPLGTLTRVGGDFRLGPVPAGTHTVRVSALGYQEEERQVRVDAGSSATERFGLRARPVELAGVQVSVLRPDMRPQGRLEEREVRETNPRDVAEALRVLPGVDAVRRGPLGLDPVVRGLRETEVGVYLDGTRQFPAGPARMDSPLTHLDPSALETVEVVKGPYALTWGAGNMGAIRVETQPIPPHRPGPLHGRVLTGYDTNLGAVETAASVFGSRQRAAYWLHGAWRQGDDYETGEGLRVPGDFLSRELRGKLGYRLAPGSWVSVAAGYQAQDDLDYPGRLLDATYFRARNLSARWTWERPAGLLRSLEALVYANDVDHAMDNDQKPTAQPMEGRMPPFALDVEVDARVAVQGGRIAAGLQPGAGWEAEVGGDVYHANRDALRTVARRDDGTLLFQDLMWPDATITVAGAFARASRELGARSTLSATVRLDRVRADADTASAFFLENVSRELDATEAHGSAALVASTRPTEHWTLSAGVGSVVRTADATERYSDRIPASKAQTSAEFVGNPALEPERSTQADLWLEAEYPRLSLSLNAFVRRIDDYVTLAPVALPRRLPLSPETVYRYVNGDAAFWGGEAHAAYALTRPLTVGVAASYLRGHDRTLDEPALGVSPPRARLSLRWQPTTGGYYLESLLYAVGEQDRVATARGEVPTPGYTTLDVQAGLEVSPALLLRVGINNALDAAYVNHLNAKNPFTATQIPEPGRVLFARLSYVF